MILAQSLAGESDSREGNNDEVLWQLDYGEGLRQWLERHGCPPAVWHRPARRALAEIRKGNRNKPIKACTSAVTFSLTATQIYELCYLGDWVAVESERIKRAAIGPESNANALVE